MALIPLVIKCGEGEHVQEKKRGANGHGYTQLGGVVPRLTGEGRIAGPLRTIRLDVRRICGDHGVPRGAGAGFNDRPAGGAVRRQSSGDGANDILVQAVEMWH